MAKKKKNPTKAKAKADTTVRFIICPKYAGARPEAAPEYLDFIVRGGNPESKAHANSVGGVCTFPAQDKHLGLANVTRRSLNHSFGQVSSMSLDRKRRRLGSALSTSRAIHVDTSDLAR